MVDFTAEGAVVVSYPTLVAAPETLLPSIEKAFGSDADCLGIIVVRDLPPEWPVYRDALLKQAYRFGQLAPDVRERYSDPASKYSFGWSHGKEIMNGKPDTLKGSYYANPIAPLVPIPQDQALQFPEYYGTNIWPADDEKGVEGFQHDFLNLSRFIFKVGCELAVACQSFTSSHFLDSSLSLSDLIAKSPTTKARLLHYFPPPSTQVPSDDEPVDNWCGFHLDHSLITGLCPAMFLRPTESGDPEVIKPPSSTSGLYIRTRGGCLTKVSVPPDCLAFQTGEALEVATNGRLRATPHCVRVGSVPGINDISRESFALFMQPNTDVQLSPTTNFGQFSKQIFEKHYDNQGGM